MITKEPMFYRYEQTLAAMSTVVALSLKEIAARSGERVGRVLLNLHAAEHDGKVERITQRAPKPDLWLRRF